MAEDVEAGALSEAPHILMDQETETGASIGTRL